MSSITPDPDKRGYLLPDGCKDLNEVLAGPRQPRYIRVNLEILAPEVRVTDERGIYHGRMKLSAAPHLAHSRGLDLVEDDCRRDPPLCRVVRYDEFKNQ